MEVVNVPVIVDAGVGGDPTRPLPLNLGVDGVLMNTGIAGAKIPLAMAQAMRLLSRPVVSLTRRAVSHANCAPRRAVRSREYRHVTSLRLSVSSEPARINFRLYVVTTVVRLLGVTSKKPSQPQHRGAPGLSSCVRKTSAPVTSTP